MCAVSFHLTANGLSLAACLAENLTFPFARSGLPASLSATKKEASKKSFFYAAKLALWIGLGGFW